MVIRRTTQVMLYLLVWLSVLGSLSYLAKNELAHALWPGARPTLNAPESHCLMLTLESLRDGHNDESIDRAVAFGKQAAPR